MSKWKKLYANRLLKLAAHLETQNSKRFDSFNFSVLIEENCNSSGCALGECVNLWPKYWVKKREPQRDHTKVRGGVEVRVKNFSPVLRGARLGGEVAWASVSFKNAATFFGISEVEADHLFEMEEQNMKWGKFLSQEATAEEVVSNIRKFVELKLAGKIKLDEDVQEEG